MKVLLLMATLSSGLFFSQNAKTEEKVSSTEQNASTEDYITLSEQMKASTRRISVILDESDQDGCITVQQYEEIKASAVRLEILNTKYVRNLKERSSLSAELEKQLNDQVVVIKRLVTDMACSVK